MPALLAALACAGAPPAGTSPAPAGPAQPRRSRPPPPRRDVPALWSSRLFLAELPVKVLPSLGRAPTVPPENIAVRLLSDDSSLLARTELGRRAHGSVTTLAMAPSRDHPGREHLGASFVIDYDQPTVARLAALLGPSPSPDDALLLVARHVEHKDFTRGFDIASRVAETRRGDCTEHAVLLGAVLRARRIPARVMLGVVVLAHDGRWLAFGHAWVEYHDGTEWRIADAALDARSLPADARAALPRVVGYVPLDPIRDEGPGFARAFVDGTLLHLRGVELGLKQ